MVNHLRVLCYIHELSNIVFYEGSYTFGYDHAGDLLHCWVHPAFIGDDCGHNTNNPIRWCLNGPGDEGQQVSNVTSCADGFIAGFVHWCSIDQKGCIDFMKTGAFDTFNGTEYQEQALKDIMKR